MNKLRYGNKLINNSINNSILNNINRNHFIKKKNMSTKVYTETHEWNIKDKYSDIITIGLSNYALEELGEIVYLEFPNDINDKLYSGDDLVIIESVKAADSIKAESNFKIIDLNFELENNLDKLNEEPENEKISWIAKIKIQD